jgi:Holliday junction resolvase RusA-like endonuclease
MKIPEYMITGNCPSKSNCYKVVRLGNRCGLGKQKKLEQYENSFKLQMLQYKYDLIETEFKFIIDVYYDSRRPDLDNALKVVLDCLQKAGAIKNDNKCIEIVAKKHLDKENPRIIFSILSM